MLADEARVLDAALIVVGHRHGRRLAELRGSVALELIDAAPCPVVVVPDALGVGGSTVVGYDGSEGARHALHWALATTAAVARSSSRARHATDSAASCRLPSASRRATA